MPRNDHGISTLIIIFIVSVVLAALVAVFVLQQHHAVSRPAAVAAARPALSAEQKAYLASLVFADFHMSAAANFLGDTVTYLDGSVTNQRREAGAPPRCGVEFRGYAQPGGAAGDRSSPCRIAPRLLQPGETRAFRVTFEHMPVDWNQAPPAASAVYVEF